MQEACGEASQTFLRDLRSPGTSENLGLGLPEQAQGWL